MRGTRQDLIVRYAHEFAGTPPGDGCGPGALLDRFVATRDEAAFRALVTRYAPLVWGVCRRALSSHQDAEDAFQATFIVLARKADRVSPREMLPGWLHGVARRAAQKVFEVSGRRREILVDAIPEPVSDAPGSCPDLSGVLDEELDRLPPKLKLAVVLCHLQGRTYAEAGRELGCSIGAVAARLEKAMAALRSRLGRRGYAPAGVLAMILMAGPAKALPPGLSARAVELALGGGSSSIGAVVAADCVARALGSSKFKLIGVVLAVACVGVAAAAVDRRSDPPGDLRPAFPVRSEIVSAAPRVDRFGDPLPDGAVARVGTVRFRPGQFPSNGDVAFLPDGRTLVSVHATGGVRFWDLASGKETCHVDGPRHCSQVAVSRDGARVIAMGSEVWALDLTPAGPRLRWKSAPGLGLLSSIALAPDGRTLACGTALGPAAYLLDASTGRTVRVLEGQSGSRVTFSPDGTTLATGMPTAAVGLWDVGTGTLVRRFGGGSAAPVTRFAFSPDGTSLATTGLDRTVRVWDTATGNLRASAPGVEAPDPFVAYTPDGRTLLEVGAEQIRYRDPAGARDLRPAAVAPHLNPLWSFSLGGGKSLSADGTLLAAEDGGVLGVWRVATGEEIGPAGALHGQVLALAFSPDGRSLATTARFSHVQLWEADTGAPIRRLPFREPGLTAYTLSYPSAERVETLEWCPEPAPHWVLTGWNPGTGEATERPGIPAALARPDPNLLPAYAASADGRWLAWGPGDGVALIDRTARAETRIARGEPVSFAEFSGDGRRLVCYGKREKALSVWDTRTGALLARLPANFDAQAERPLVALSRDGSRIAYTRKAPGGGDEIRVEELRGETVVRVAAPRQTTLVLAFSPDARFLAAGGEDGVVRVWDLQTGKECRRLEGHTSRVQVLAFSPDGRRLASGSADSTALVWDTALFGQKALTAPIPSTSQATGRRE
ncbi:wd-40 repeat protein : Uncultured bacterium genome assembly Metasoil_fosmids_resub OS=uncultured bacterium PE=4 SV=1: Sigma70_r2: Sigma70_r4_2: WD40: WD40: WD40 [Gemmata massiliana]|uniref:ECF RNA polymerase sigma factor SigE n=1 Tax=Gemmata massiliana TaxID=1210884 RepID=A0A6P2CXF2_9BACT|nr:sigma-70 family RNA polymerase sigma factor [Gemmata massiliana]VTR92424.1 wd-40 repeat protein : Uncultured bacterium genome assembly Metasoil_fosmids_resub OS=uncultured bacterium PE=4 SV=1: Sigma70_r2: Sigma70_r4_2: WD40: WD40: WD40 [Gemmata massiliana]